MVVIKINVSGVIFFINGFLEAKSVRSLQICNKDAAILIMLAEFGCNIRGCSVQIIIGVQVFHRCLVTCCAKQQ